MSDLNKLAQRLNNYADKLEAAPSKVAALVALRLTQELVQRTPVDTSEALSNWLLSLDEPVLVHIDAYTLGFNGSTATSSQNAAIAFAKRQLANKKPGQTIFLSNSAPHIRKLQEGSSSQAPSGFLLQSLAIARRQVKPLFKQVMKNG